MKFQTVMVALGLACTLFLVSCSEHHGHHKTEKSDMEIKKPNRVSHTYTQTVNGSFEEVMPLYCPVRELDWCENWGPKAVYSNCGVVEKDCMFITAHGDDDVLWIVSDYDIEAGCVVMYYHVPKTLVTKLEIQLTAISKTQSKAVLTYSKTSLSQEGDKALKHFTKTEYDIMMDSWEKAMNHYIATGEMLTGLPNF